MTRSEMVREQYASGGRRDHGVLLTEVKHVLAAFGVPTRPVEVYRRLTARGVRTTRDCVNACMSGAALRGRLLRCDRLYSLLPEGQEPEVLALKTAIREHGPLVGVHPGRVLTLGAHRATVEPEGYQCRLCGKLDADRFDLALSACA